MAVPLAVGCPASSADGGERKQMTFPASSSSDGIGSHVDVVIVGAGISGIGVACHLKTRMPGKTFATRADVREYALDHFDVYDGIWQLRVLADQLDFLSRTLGSAHSTERRVELPA